MGFVAETKIMTDKGWKLISDISGRDRVLVRNFLGDAEFIQPFALRKSSYEGEIITFGTTYWAVSVTPNHKVVYDTRPQGFRKLSQNTIAAKNVKVNENNHLYRKFRYIREDKTNESVTLYGDIKRTVVISDQDWYTIVAYMVTCGYISKDANPRLKFMVGDNKNISPITNIFDMMGITWNLGYVNDVPVVTVNRDNNLARKLKRFLGARARRDMAIPNKMLYGSSQSLMKHFMNTVTTLVAKPSQKRPNQLLLASTNRKFVDGLRMMCMFCGYAFSATETHGEYIIYIIPGNVSPWSIRFVERSIYSGPVYEIDLFDGLVYVTERNLPAWMSPK